MLIDTDSRLANRILSGFHAGPGHQYRDRLCERPGRAWRYWDIAGGKLIAPHVNEPLPDDGLLVAGCGHGHRPPCIGCWCGVHFFARIENLRQAIDRFDLLDRYAFTDGIAYPPVLGDARPLARVDQQRIPIPDAYRARAYRVTTIYSDATLDYDLPTRPVLELGT